MRHFACVVCNGGTGAVLPLHPDSFHPHIATANVHVPDSSVRTAPPPSVLLGRSGSPRPSGRAGLYLRPRSRGLVVVRSSPTDLACSPSPCGVLLGRLRPPSRVDATAWSVHACARPSRDRFLPKPVGCLPVSARPLVKKGRTTRSWSSPLDPRTCVCAGDPQL